MFGISVAEYAPNQVKKTVVGAGHADKNQIAVMPFRLGVPPEIVLVTLGAARPAVA